jgi:hypothetical protein
MKRLLLPLVLALAAAATFQACGGSTNSGFGRDGGGGAGGSSGDAAHHEDVPVLQSDAKVDQSGCVSRCSDDLHSVLDCDGKVLLTCPSTEGCGAGGMCVPACQSAAANQSSVGCDYYSIVPAGGINLSDGSCFAAFIANTWNGPATLGVEYAGKSIPLTQVAFTTSGSGTSLTYTPLKGGVLPEGQLAILFLNDDQNKKDFGFHIDCPAAAVAAVSGALASSDVTSIMSAFHITSSVPVVAYDMFPYGGKRAHISSATLLLPTPAWGTNYLAVDSFTPSQVEAGYLNPFLQIAAAEDGTQVTLSPTAKIVGGTGVAPAAVGVPTTYTLGAGQVLQLIQPEELNGTPIKSNKPVGVWGGANCMNIDVKDSACDSGHQQLPPVHALGDEYVAVRYRPRDPKQPSEAPPWRVMGAVDGTTLTYEPSAPAGAPSTLSSGELVIFKSAGPFVVKSQDAKHPFYMSAHMGGEQYEGGNYLTGDPEHVNVMPPAEYLSSYIFMTDPTMGNTNLVLVRASTSGKFEDVTLDCMSGPVTGWTPIGSSGTYEYAWVDLVVGGAAQGKCDNGYHTIKSAAPFGITVWGWDSYVSYAYPAGASVHPINTVVVLPAPK